MEDCSLSTVDSFESDQSEDQFEHTIQQSFDDIENISRNGPTNMVLHSNLQASIGDQWKKLFATALCPKVIKDPRIQLPHNTRQQRLQINTNGKIGDAFVKDHNCFRIWNVNANTILAHDDYAEFHDLCAQLKKYNVAVLGMQELNVDILQYKVRNCIVEILKENSVSVKVVFSTTPILAPTIWKPGGTLIAVLGKYSHRVINTSAGNE